MCAVLADAEPWWEPGTRFGYHAQTFGFLLGEIVRRATGRTISALLRDLVTGPLGVEDQVCFGVPRPLLPLVARQVAAGGPAPAWPEPGSPQDRAVPRGIRPSAEFANRADVLASDIPSAGTMTARGVARMYSALLGHVGGVALVSPGRLAAMAAVAFTGMDQVMGFPVRGGRSATARTVLAGLRRVPARLSGWWGSTAPRPTRTSIPALRWP
jgi:CubicO group peptidase (beta-lactamase class C family)